MAPASLNTELLLDQLVGEFEAGRIGQGVLLLAGMLDGAAENAAGIALARAALEPWHGLKACAPVPAGGMSVERVDEMLAFYGHDVILLIGGALLTAGEALPQRAREFVTRVRDAGTANESPRL